MQRPSECRGLWTNALVSERQLCKKDEQKLMSAGTCKHSFLHARLGCSCPCPEQLRLTSPFPALPRTGTLSCRMRGS